MGTDIDCAEDQTALTIVDGIHLYFFRVTSPFFCNSVSNSNIKSNSIRYETYRSNSGRNASNKNACVCIYFFVFSKAKYFVKSIFTLFLKIMSSSNNKYNRDITSVYLIKFNLHN